MEAERIYLFGPGDAEEREALSWHDLGASRIWLHSRVIEGVRQVIAVEVEFAAGSQAVVSDAEKRLRADLASRRVAPRDMPKEPSTILRRVPVSRLLETHAGLVAHLSQPLRKSANAVRLVDSGTGPTRQRREPVELDSSKPNALAVAALYERAVATGQPRPAQWIAKSLGVEAELIHRCVRVARRSGWMSSAGAGVAGGELTEAGRVAAESELVASRIERLLSLMEV